MRCRSSDRHHVKEGADRGGGPARAQSNEMQGHFGNGGRLLRGATFSQENGLSWTASQAASAGRIVARKTRCRVRRGSLRRHRGVFGQSGGVADRGPVRQRSGNRSGSGRRAALRRCMAPVREPRKNRHAPSSEGTGLGKVSLPELGGLPRGGCVRAFARRNVAAAARWRRASALRSRVDHGTEPLAAKSRGLGKDAVRNARLSPARISNRRSPGSLVPGM